MSHTRIAVIARRVFSKKFRLPNSAVVWRFGSLAIDSLGSLGNGSLAIFIIGLKILSLIKQLNSICRKVYSEPWINRDATAITDAMMITSVQATAMVF